MKKNVSRATGLALALCLLFAACGGQGALPSDAPPEGPPAKITETVPPVEPAPIEKAPGEEEAPDESEAPPPEGALGEGEAPPPEEDSLTPSEESPYAVPTRPEGRELAKDIAPALEGLGETDWQIVSISAKDYGIVEAPIGDPAIYGGVASLSLGKLTAVSLASDGAAGEDVSDELWRRFLKDPDTVLAYLALMGDQQDGYWQCPAAEVICRTIASADAAWYNSIEFGEALAACRETYPTGRAAELLDVMELEHAAGLQRNGWQGAEPSHAPPREPPLEGWQAVDIGLDAFGLKRTLDDLRFEYIFNHTDTVPLDQLIVFDLWGDALTEGSSEELRSRFLEAPDTVLAYLVLMGDQRVDYWDQPLAADKICNSIATADAAWHGGSEEFAATMASCRERYPSGRISELLDVLEEEHAASMERNYGQSE